MRAAYLQIICYRFAGWRDWQWVRALLFLLKWLKHLTIIHLLWCPSIWWWCFRPRSVETLRYGCPLHTNGIPPHTFWSVFDWESRLLKPFRKSDVMVGVRFTPDFVAKVPKDAPANFPPKNETSGDRRSIGLQTRYQNRPSVWRLATWSPT